MSMSEADIKTFLGQFANSEQSIEQWPTWMQEATKVATASFPHQRLKRLNTNEAEEQK